MKKIIPFFVMATTALVIPMSATTAFAGTVNCSGYIDANFDGICDNCKRAEPINGTNKKIGQARLFTPKKFVDVDGDGLCDYCQCGNMNKKNDMKKNQSQNPMENIGQRNIMKQSNYTDQNGDGVCDYKNTGTCSGFVCNGIGRQYRSSKGLK